MRINPRIVSVLLYIYGAVGPPGAISQPSSFERIREIPHALGIVQDHAGFMWFATMQGLIRYDGYSVRLFAYDPADSTSLSFNRTACVYVDREGTLWVGTSGGGLNSFDQETETFTHFRRRPGDPYSLSQDTVTAIIEDREGVIWVGTIDGLNSLDRKSGRFRRYPHDPADPTSLSARRVWALREDRKGTIWVGTVKDDAGLPLGGLNKLNRVTGTFTHYLPDAEHSRSPIANDVQALYEDSGGNFWVGTRKGGLFLMDRDRETFTRHDIPDHPDWPRQPQLGQDSVFGGTRFLHEDRTGTLWIGVVFGGLFVRDPATGVISPFKKDPEDQTSLGNNLRDYGVWAIYESRDEVLWLGTWNGLYKRHAYRGKLPHFRIASDDPVGFNAVNSLFQDSTGLLWIGTRAGGLIKHDRQRGILKRYLHDPFLPNILSSNGIWEVHGDRRGILWIGTMSGLDRFDPKTERFEHFQLGPNDWRGSDDGLVSAIHEDRRGILWLATRLGLVRIDPETNALKRFRHDPSDLQTLSRDDLTTIHEDLRGVLWIGTTDGGLNRFDPETEQVIRYIPIDGDPGSLNDHTVSAIYSHHDNVIWIGTESGGLNRFDVKSGTFRHFTVQNGGLSDNHVTAILGDESGNLWVRLRRGLVRFDTEGLTYRTYAEDIGSWIFGIAHRSSHGEMFFGSTDGFYDFHPSEVEADPHPPTVRIAGFRVSSPSASERETESWNAHLRTAAEIRVTHDQNGFTFDFVGLQFGSPSENRYAFTLEGLESEWRDGGTQRSATYVRVPPGRYVFRVRAANADGVWSEEGAFASIVIMPPWWLTWWAYSAYGLLIMTGVVAAARFQRKRLIRSEREQAAIREAVLRGDVLEADNRLKEVELEKARELDLVNTDLRAHKRQLEEQNARLAELDELKSRFFANISHEFRTPLTLIIGPVKDALANLSALDVRNLRMIHRNAQRLLLLINQLLDLSRLEAGGMHWRPTRSDVVAFLHDVTLAFSPRAERERVALSFHARPDHVLLRFDREKLEKIICNLLSNAFKFTAAGGHIAVNVQVLSESNGEFVEIGVADNGKGIPAAELPRIFDRFYQADASSTRRHEGSGIGLALSKELVDLHGGQIRVESEVAVGTTFYVRLPVNRQIEPEACVEAGDPLDADFDGDSRSWLIEGERESATLESSASRPVHHEYAATVLIVEDNADVRAYLRAQLHATYGVIEARDGVEGIESAREKRPDLILADIMMPRMDGYSLCRELKSDPELNHIPVVLVTAKADEASKLEGLELRADDYLIKPFSAEELLYRVENLIELRRILRSRYSREVVIEPGRIVVRPEKAAFLERLQGIVEARLDDPGFDVDQLADEMNVSSRQLQRRLRELRQLSAAGYIRLMRLQRAAQLLEQEAGRVQDVAYSVGFHDPKHFSTLFRQVFGVPPSAYMRQT